MGHVMTVRGPVSADEIGPVLAHEHLFMDATSFWDPADLNGEYAGTEPFSAEVAAIARWSGHVFRDNMVLSSTRDYDLIRRELASFVEAAGPGACTVELTTVGLSPQPAALRRIAEDLDTHVVSGAGWYVHAMHPAWVDEASVDDLERLLLRDVQEGYGDTGVKPGIIGEIGTSVTVLECEERALRAAARVARQTGLAVNVHCEPPSLEVVHHILDVIADEGHDLTRTYLSHLDEIWQLEYHQSVLERGVIVGFDSFGQDGYFTPSWKSLSDLTKMTTIKDLVALGFGAQIVLAQDVCKKHHLLQFGGFGYGHVVRRVVPRMTKLFDLDPAIVEAMLVTTPRRLLTIGGPEAG